MDLYVKDIEKIWSNGSATLVAGKKGIMRKVVAYDMMEQPNVKEWLREHLLIITTGYAIPVSYTHLTLPTILRV